MEHPQSESLLAHLRNHSNYRFLEAMPTVISVVTLVAKVFIYARRRHAKDLSVLSDFNQNLKVQNVLIKTIGYLFPYQSVWYKSSLITQTHRYDEGKSRCQQLLFECF
jgi:hypothetical protein